MELFYYVLSHIVVLIVGYIMGIVHKGIHIHYHKEEVQEEGYTESLVDMMDPEMRKYFEDNNGMKVR